MPLRLSETEHVQITACGYISKIKENRDKDNHLFSYEVNLKMLSSEGQFLVKPDQFNNFVQNGLVEKNEVRINAKGSFVTVKALSKSNTHYNRNVVSRPYISDIELIK